MMNMYISATVNVEDVTLTFADHNAVGKWFIKDGYRMVVLDELH